MSASACPDAALLRRLLDETAGDEAALSAHLESCAHCQQSLQRLAAGADSWSGARAELAQSDLDETPDPALARAVAVLERDDAGAEPAEVLSYLQPPAQPGHLGRLGHYEVLEVIGSGGMGVVLKAIDEKLQRIVAIKVMAPELAASGSARKRFSREAQAAAAIAHEHVVTIHAVEDSHRPPYLVMQYVPGPSLQQRLDDAGPLEVKEVLRIGYQTACGLAAAHAQGLVHRDVKPANILLENGVQRVKLSDFGLARAADDASVTQPGVIVGTPMYMSPEQARGEPVDHRADLFSLGSVLYAMCTGQPPYRAATLHAVLHKVAEETPRPARAVQPEVPDWLEAIIVKLHARRPEDRFQSAAQVAELLRQHLAHLQQPTGTTVPPSAPTTRSRRWLPRVHIRPCPAPRSLPIALLFFALLLPLSFVLLRMLVNMELGPLPFQIGGAALSALLVLTLWRLAGLGGLGYFVALLMLSGIIAAGVPALLGLDGSGAPWRLLLGMSVLALAAALALWAWQLTALGRATRIFLAGTGVALSFYALAALLSPFWEYFHREGMLVVQGDASLLIRVDSNRRVYTTMGPGQAILPAGRYDVTIMRGGRVLDVRSVIVAPGSRVTISAPPIMSPGTPESDGGQLKPGEDPALPSPRREPGPPIRRGP